MIPVDVEATILRMIEAAPGLTVAEVTLRTGLRDVVVLDVLLALQTRGLVRAEQGSPAQPRRWFVVGDRPEEAP